MTGRPRRISPTSRLPRATPIAPPALLHGGALLAAMLLLGGAAPAAAQGDAVVVYLVRHAERADDEGPVDPSLAADPPLSTAGEARARELAELLDDVRLTHLHSTEYERTRATVRPMARVTGLPITPYDGADLAALAGRLVATPGVHLVVGHSNTTPALVEALGGDAGDPIEELEYDRVYVLYLLPGGAAGSAVFRYGTPYSGGP